MKTLFRALATCAMCLSIPVGAVTLLPADDIAAEAQFHRDHDDRRDAEIRRGLARRAAISQSSEARRYRAQRRAEIVMIVVATATVSAVTIGAARRYAARVVDTASAATELAKPACSTTIGRDVTTFADGGGCTPYRID